MMPWKSAASSVHTHGHVQIELGAIAEERRHQFQRIRIILRIGIHDAHQSRLGHGIDRYDGRAVALGSLQGGQHPRMIRRWIASDDEKRVTMLEIFERDRRLADAYGFW